MKINYKIWLEKDGKQVFGEGIYRLLRFVDELGSINQAACKERMSYRQAWGKIKRIEKRLGVKLLNRQIGGASGGGAVLTAEAKGLMRKYRMISRGIHTSLKQISNDLSIKTIISEGDE